MTADIDHDVTQIVSLECGHRARYRIGRALAESGFARPGVAWRCTACDPTGDTRPRISTVENLLAPA